MLFFLQMYGYIRQQPSDRSLKVSGPYMSDLQSHLQVPEVFHTCQSASTLEHIYTYMLIMSVHTCT